MAAAHSQQLHAPRHVEPAPHPDDTLVRHAHGAGTGWRFKIISTLPPNPRPPL